MPNWCYTDINFYGSKKDISDFFNRIDEYISKNFRTTDFGTNWLGNILCGFGLGDKIDDPETKLRCRGSLEFISDLDIEDENAASFSITTSTAWGPMIKMWHAIIEKHYANRIELHWIAEEPNTYLYLTDDKSRYKDSYWVDCEFPDDQYPPCTYYFSTTKDVADFINSNFKNVSLSTSTDFETTQTFEEGNKRIVVIPLVDASLDEID